MIPLPRRPIVLETAVDDPSLVHRMIDAHAPYWPVQRYFANGAGMRRSGEERGRHDHRPGLPRELGGRRRGA
jgi:hypothetical protein